MSTNFNTWLRRSHPNTPEQAQELIEAVKLIENRSRYKWHPLAEETVLVDMETGDELTLGSDKARWAFYFLLLDLNKGDALVKPARKNTSLDEFL